MSSSTSEMEKFIRAEVNEVVSIIRETHSIILPFLRFHLLTENLLERIVISHLARAKRFLDEANPRYYHKLCLVDSFNILDEKTMGAIKNLNSIRNRLAHSRKASISVKDLDRIGNHFGKEYKKLRAECLNDTKELMCCVFELILFRLSTTVYHLEHGTRSQGGE